MTTTCDEIRVALVPYMIAGGRGQDACMAEIERLVLAGVRALAEDEATTSTPPPPPASTSTGDRPSIIVLPELFFYDCVAPAGTTTAEDAAVLLGLARDLSPRLLRRVAALCRQHRVHVLVGSLPVAPRRLAKDQVRNRAYLIGPTGRCAWQDKLFLTPEERALGWSAGDSLQVVDAAWGPTAVLVCFDSEVPAVSQALCTQGNVDLLLVPSLTGRRGWLRVHACSRARAVEHRAFVCVTGCGPAAADNAGPPSASTSGSATDAEAGKGPAAASPYTCQSCVYGPIDAGFPCPSSPSAPIVGRPVNDPRPLVARLDMRHLRESKRGVGEGSAAHPVWPAWEQRLRIKTRGRVEGGGGLRVERVGLDLEVADDL